jgi:fucose permease
MGIRDRSRLLRIGISYASFVALGLPGGYLGVAWPSMRGEFELSLDAVGAMLVVFTVGSLVASFASGPAISRFGAGRFLAVSSLAAAVGLLGYGLAPSWWFVVMSGLLVGAAAGAIDSGLNVYFAENHGSRLMNWLHACFGLGATIGPALMTVLLRGGYSWRWGYAVSAAVQAVLAVSFGLTHTGWRDPQRAVAGAPRTTPSQDAGLLASLGLPVVWLSVGVFLLSAGAESVAGQWPYSLFTEARGVDPAVAGIWVSLYWGALTLSRILYGAVATRLRDVASLRIGMAAIVVGSVLLWWRTADVVSFLGLALIGFATAPVLPLLQLVTPRRVGAGHTANAIGLQTAAGYLGVGVLPALAGNLAERLGLETIGPFLVVSGVLMLLLHEVIVRSYRGESRWCSLARGAQEVADGEA